MPSKSQQGWRRVQGLVVGIALALSIQVAPPAQAAAAPVPVAHTPASAASAARGDVHVVRPGESLWSIAERELGDGSKWRKLYRLNRERVGPDPRVIRPGQRLVLAPGIPVSQAAKRYRVKPGDSLWSIAERKLGAGERWKRLYKLNREKVGDNPRHIEVGTLLVLRDPAAKPVAEATAPKPVAKAPAAKPAAKPVAKAPAAKPAAKPVAKAPAPKPAAKPEAKAPAPKPAARPQAKAPAAKPQAKAPAPKPAAKPEAKAPGAEVRNPFEFNAGQAGAISRPDAAGTPPGRNPFEFGGHNSPPGSRTVQGEAQRRVGGMPVVPSYPEDKALAGRKGKAPVAVDVKGGKAVAKKKGRKHMASSPGPRTKKQ